MRSITWILVLFLLGCQARKKNSPGFYFPAEWEQQQSVWLGWSKDPSIQKVHLQMAEALAGQVKLAILSRSDTLHGIAMKQLSEKGIDTTQVLKFIHYIPNVFLRDAGPRFLKNENGELAIADFAWNNYGYPASFAISQYSDRRGEIDNALAKEHDWKIISSDFVSEGGGIDASTNMLLSFAEMALQRHPGKTLAEIEKEYLRVYGKKKMIWLNRMPLMDKVTEGPKAGNYFGYGANGHTDEFVRFANDSTILIGIIDSSERNLDPVSMIDYDILNENLEIVRNARDMNGKPFRIITLPVPNYSLYAEKEVLTDSIKENGDGRFFFKSFNSGDEIYWLPAVSYLNFFISNKVVLVAKYWEQGLPETERMKDEKVKAVLQELFPDRKIVQINPMGLNRYGGGMHCATQQQPR